MERHLNLADLHIGEWVYEYSDITEKPLCPMYVSALFEDGTVYLNFNGNEFDVWEANIEDIAPVKIDEDVLKGFGFRKGAHRTDWLYDVDDLQIVFDANPCSMNFFVRHHDGGTSPCFDSYYIHQLQDVYCRFTQKPLNLNWKGI